MKTAEIYIQCKYPNTGEIGSFLANEDGAQSPCFPDCYDLFQWCIKNGWHQKHAGLNSPYVKSE